MVCGCGCNARVFICVLLIHMSCGDLPTFLELPTEGTTTQINGELTLKCSASGTPTPKIVNWLLNDKPVSFDTGRHYLRKSGDLYVNRVQRSDSGFYQCVAQNIDGGIASDKKRVYVAYFDRMDKPTVQQKSVKEKTSYIILPPKFNCEPKPKFIWKKDDKTIVESIDLHISQDGGLYLSNVNIGTQGTYTLSLENSHMLSKNMQYATQEALEIDLTILPNSNKDLKVSVIYSSPKQEAGETKTPSVTLECFVTGIDGQRSTLGWQRIDTNSIATTIRTNSKYVIKDQTRRLVIKNPKHDDSGTYRCVPYYVLNDFNNNAKEIEVVVSAPPGFVTRARKLEVYTDNSTMLNCSTYGLPVHTTRWYRNGIPLETSGDKHTIYQNNSLLIESLNWQDNGLFQCGAENKAGLNFLQIILNVKNITAEIVDEFKDQFLYFDTTAAISCRTIGAPKPSVSWKKNSFRLNDNSKYTILQNDSLLIKDIKASDSGVYTCIASNYIQTVDKSASVFIVTPTRISNFPPREHAVPKGSTRSLPCEVEHDPRVNYTREWRFNNLPISNSYYVVQSDGSLRVDHVQTPRDTNKDFSCHIFADDGNFSQATFLVIKNRPLQPSSLRVGDVDIQPFSLRVHWDAPSDGGSALTAFTLYMRNFTKSSYVVIANVNASETTYLIKNLRAGSKYRFQVMAENKFGPSERSAESEWIETKTLAPSGSPRNFRSVDAGTDYVKLKWEAPPEGELNGELLGYSIGYRVAGYEGVDSFTITKLSDVATQYEMVGLPLFTKYEVKIAADNIAGRGPWTDSKYVETLQGTPSMPPTNVKVSVKNSTTVLVSFTSPPQQQWNGKLTSIVARFWPPEKPRDQQQYVTDYDTSSIYKQSFYLPTLEADKEYVLAVAVKTTGGRPSPGSMTVQFKTTEGAPEDVQDLQVSDTYSDAFSVSWKPPIKKGGTLTGYVVRYRVFTSQKWKELTENGKALGAVVPNLQPKTKYEVDVAAMTSVGRGPFTRRSAITTEKPELPKAPGQLKAYGVWGSSIALGWTPGDSGRAVILYYKIDYNNDTDYHQYPERAKWHMIRNLTKILENPANLTGLKPSSIYRFRMTAVNRVGASPISNISEDITTGEGVPSKAPTKIIITAPVRSALLIKWSPPSRDSWNSGSVKYQFLVKPIDLDPKIKVPYVQLYDTLATSYTAKGLQMFTIYNVTIRLYNDKGYGPWSEPHTYRTSEDFPSGAPRILHGVVLGSSSVRLKWAKVAESERNGVILGYKVFYNIRDIENTEQFKDFPDNNTFSGEITGLYGYTDYEFRLLAYTKVGGKFKSSPWTLKTKEGVPDKPTNVRFTRVTYSLVEVEWDAPTRPNGQIVTYRVHYRQNVTDSKWIEVPVSLFSSRSAIARGLVFNKYYIFKIEGRTAPGWGKAALEYVLVTTDREVPESPVMLGIPYSSVRHTSVIVQWRPRSDRNSPIRSFNLEYQTELSGAWITYKYGLPPVKDIPTDINEVEVKDLDYGTRYEFRVRANNDIGSSAWSAKSPIVTTHQKDPVGAPDNVRVIKKTPTSLVVAWDKPTEFDLSSDISGYVISWELLSGISKVKQKTVDENIFELSINNLKVFTAYEVRVGVYSGLRDAMWSQKYKWITGEDAPLEAPTDLAVELQGRDIVRVTWSPPDDVRGWTLGYKIESRRIGHASNKRKRRNSPNENPIMKRVNLQRLRRRRRSLPAVCKNVPPVTTHLAGPYSQEVTLKNLRKYSRYVITVRVYNSFGDGPKSVPVSFSTPSDVPGPPYILSDRVYSESIAVDFAEPCEANGKILGYRVRHKEWAQKYSPDQTYSASTRRVEIANLKQLTSYIFELSAKTSHGYGQFATIDFITRGPVVFPDPPGPPEVYRNEPGHLLLQWDERDTGNAPVLVFILEYKKNGGSPADFKDASYKEVLYDGSMAVYNPGTLKPAQNYQFRVKSQTRKGTSQWGEWSKPITPVSVTESSKPFYKEIWFIFLIVVIVLIIIIVIAVCCWKHGCKEKYNSKSNGYNISTFQMGLLKGRGESDAGSDRRLLGHNGSTAPSVASSTRKSIAKSSSSLANSEDREPLTQQNTPSARREMPDDSIANHYSNDPFHKNWRDSLDKKTKKEILAEYAKRRPSNASVDSMEQKKRGEPIYDRARPRPGRQDISELRNLARSQPELVVNPYQPNARQQSRRPGKRPINHDLARSEPELNRSNTPSDTQIKRQSSFLRATAGDSEEDDNESLRDVFQREKSKREMALDYDNRPDDFYPNAAPPPYDYNGAPPAYSPSDVGSEMSEFDYGRKRPSYPSHPQQQQYPPRVRDYSDQSDFSRPSNSGYSRPPARGYFSPEAEYPRYQPSPSPRYPPGPQHPPVDDYAQVYPPKAPSSSTEPPHSVHSSDHHFAPSGRFSPPQNAYIDDDDDDEVDGYEPDMTLV